MPTPTDPQPAQPWEQARHAAASGPAGVPAETPVVDTDGVVEAAHAATAHKLGNSVRGHLVVDTAVRVDLTSWPRARETATFLTELGYQVSGPEPAPDSSGWSVTVAGWDTERLQSRACALEQAVRDLGARHGDVAGEAVTRFQAYLRQGMNQNTAHQQATADMPFAPQTPPGLGPPVSERDLALGPPEHQEPLVRIAAAQATWRNLATTNVARQAIGLYLTFTQAFGHPADRAHAQVVAEAVQGVRSEHDTVLFHLRERLSTDRHPENHGERRPAPPAAGVRAQRPTLHPPPTGGPHTGHPGLPPPASPTASPPRRGR